MNRFEIVDITSEEVYHSLASFPTLEIAVQEIESELNKRGPNGITEVYDDEVTFSIIQHPDGWGSTKFVWTQVWTAAYEDGKDEPTWGRVSETNIPT